MVKGVSTAMVMVLSLFAIVMILTSLLPMLVSETIKEKIELQKNVYMMKNSLEAAGLYTRTALRYSLYQSCFDTLKNLEKQEGGLIAEKDFTKTIEEETGKNFKVYTGGKYRFLRDYMVEMPDYNLKIEEADPEKIRIKADSSDNLKIEKTEENETIVLEKSSTLDETVKIPCFAIFRKGRELEAAVKEKASQIILEELKKWPENGVLIADENPSDFDVFRAAADEKGLMAGESEEATEKLLADKINQSLAKEFSGLKEDDFVADIFPANTAADITVKCTGGININQEGKYVKECSFYYKSDAITSVNIGDETKLPVFNGTDISFEPLRLEYAVKSSGLYPTKPFEQ
jgi:hypothetical protein